MYRFVLALIGGVLLGAPAWAEVYEAPSPTPTVEETLILEFINRARADPAAEGERILASDIRVPGDVDKAMFAQEMREIKPAPPLVFNLQLLDAARKHAHYMVLNEQGHGQVEGRPGFTGKSMSDRIKGAGYRGGAMAENAFRSARARGTATRRSRSTGVRAARAGCSLAGATAKTSTARPTARSAPRRCRTAGSFRWCTTSAPAAPASPGAWSTSTRTTTASTTPAKGRAA